MMCGSIRLVYALVYTLFLGFGLRIGSDFYLLLDPSERRHLSMLAGEIDGKLVVNGTFFSDNSTRFDNTSPLFGTWTFFNSTSSNQDHIFKGCERPPGSVWYLQVFPWWTQLFMVPIFAICSSMANLQPWKSKEMVVMVVIACVAWTANEVVGRYIKARSDYVSFVAAMVVGLIGNIYSRRMGGTAFTSMVTGVLFLVPVSFIFSRGDARLTLSIVTYFFTVLVRSIAERRHHGWKQRRGRRRNAINRNWNYRGADDEPSRCIRFRPEEKRGHVHVLVVI